jgi:hypothetical protein
MAKPILALARLSFDGTQGKVVYRYGRGDADKVEMDYLDFIARLTAHIPGGPQKSGSLAQLPLLAVIPLTPVAHTPRNPRKTPASHLVRISNFL